MKRRKLNEGNEGTNNGLTLRIFKVEKGIQSKGGSSSSVTPNKSDPQFVTIDDDDEEVDNKQ